MRTITREIEQNISVENRSILKFWQYVKLYFFSMDF